MSELRRDASLYRAGCQAAEGVCLVIHGGLSVRRPALRRIVTPGLVRSRDAHGHLGRPRERERRSWFVGCGLSLCGVLAICWIWWMVMEWYG
jgi:hypothetical protein